MVNQSVADLEFEGLMILMSGFKSNFRQRISAGFHLVLGTVVSVLALARK
jgi:hypothetical protein